MMVKDNNEINYFKIGSFVLVGIGLIIFALLIFGANRLFQPVVYIETYFDESIQGVAEGTPVKYRGVQIGYISDITFTSEIYQNKQEQTQDNRDRSIYVKIAITSKLFTKLSSGELIKFLTEEVVNGLRIKLVAQGLTGTSYLEFDYVNPKNNQIPDLNWQPNNFYVPAVTSTLTRLSESAQYIMNELKDVDFKQLFLDTNKLVNSLNQAITNVDKLVNNLNSPAETTINNLQTVSEDLKMLTERLKLKPSDLVFSSYPPPLNPSKL